MGARPTVTSPPTHPLLDQRAQAESARGEDDADAQPAILQRGVGAAEPLIYQRHGAINDGIEQAADVLIAYLETVTCRPRVGQYGQ
jgi:hypothetical protein